MSEKEKEVAKTLADAFNVLPDEKKEYLIGYAEGVAAMVEKRPAKKKSKDKPMQAG